MAKKAKGLYAKVAHVPVFHKTNIGRNPSKAKMNYKTERCYTKTMVHNFIRIKSNEKSMEKIWRRYENVCTRFKKNCRLGH